MHFYINCNLIGTELWHYGTSITSQIMYELCIARTTDDDLMQIYSNVVFIQQVLKFIMFIQQVLNCIVLSSDP
jgi:hypothetical protein